MGESVLKTLVIYIATLVIALALAVVLILVPAYVHYGEIHIPGSYNALYLSKYSPYKTIVVEIDYQPGMEPAPETVEALQQQIEMYSGKEVLIYLNQDIEENEVPAVIRGDDLFKTTSMLQEHNRDYRTGWFGGNITLYILYLDTVWHPKDQDYSTRMPASSTKPYSVGVTYAADSIIIFKGSLPQNGMETTILLHELGHIWGFGHTNESDNIMNAEFEVYKNGPSPDDVVETWYPKDFSPAQKEELARLHETMHILPLFN
ncbi:MAG: hypothetical protein K8R17_13065 [Methanosarcinales archaeon]|nr:hypothetical protein [Methanosarcinales archaeon]